MNRTTRTHDEHMADFDMTREEFYAQFEKTKATMAKTAKRGGLFIAVMIGVSLVSSCALIYLMYAAAQWLMANQ